MPYTDLKKRLEYNRRWNKEYYKNHKEAEKLRTAKRKAEIVSWFLRLKSRFHCKICGEKEIVCLDFHHVKKTQKDFSLGLLKRDGWGREKIIKEIDKCVVLCSNCHRKLHHGLINI